MALLTSMYSGLDTKIDYLTSKIQSIENEIFHDQEKELLYEISAVSRRLITFQQTVKAHETALENLKDAMIIAFGKSHTGSIENIQLTYTHLLRRIVGLTHTLQDLRETNNALLTTKQNEVMKILTILAFITFPLTLFTSLFGMNTIATPLVGTANDFWYIVGIMFLVSIGFFGYFKYKKWM